MAPAYVHVPSHQALLSIRPSGFSWEHFFRTPLSVASPSAKAVSLFCPLKVILKKKKKSLIIAREKRRLFSHHLVYNLPTMETTMFSGKQSNNHRVAGSIKSVRTISVLLLNWWQFFLFFLCSFLKKRLLNPVTEESVDCFWPCCNCLDVSFGKIMNLKSVPEEQLLRLAVLVNNKELRAYTLTCSFSSSTEEHCHSK